MSRFVLFSRKRLPPRLLVAGVLGAFALLGACGYLGYVIVTGGARVDGGIVVDGGLPEGMPEVRGESPLVARGLDGVLVLEGQEALRPWAFMIDNQVDARPAAGLSQAPLVIEAPVEGGITRLLAFFDPAQDIASIGAVRSSRPYFVDWAAGWRAVYAHAGGSPEALDLLAKTPSSTVRNVDELIVGSGGFVRDPKRLSPHQVMTSSERFSVYLGSATSSLATFRGWRYREATSSTTVTTPSVRIPYGGSYTARWTYDQEAQGYVRTQAGKALSLEPIVVKNVVVLKTDGTILDDKGRLRIRTTGSGEAALYHEGGKYLMRWRRSPGESIRFVTIDGTDVELIPGSTWIQVVTDDRIFAGLDAS